VAEEVEVAVLLGVFEAVTVAVGSDVLVEVAVEVVLAVAVFVDVAVGVGIDRDATRHPKKMVKHRSIPTIAPNKMFTTGLFDSFIFFSLC
jgi:hypothetical protein